MGRNRAGVHQLILKFMKVLSIDRDRDRKIFEDGDATRERMVEYGKKMEEMHSVVFVLKKHGLKTIAISENVFVHPTNSLSRWFFLWDAIRLGKKIIRENKFVRGDCVVTCQDPFECGFVGWRVAGAFHLPLHLQIHTDFLSRHFKTSFLQKCRVWFAKFLIPRADFIRAVSLRIVESLKDAGVKTKHPVRILPIRIDAEAIISKNSTAENSDLKKMFPQFKFIILMASRLSKEKRIIDAISAFASVAKNYPDAGLVIAGDGPLLSELKNKAKNMDIFDKVFFLGFCEDIFSLMKTADIFLTCSEYEGYGMSVVEAGLSHLPVISTAVGLSGELLIHLKNSYICPVYDTVCIAKGIEMMLGNEDLRRELSTALFADITARMPKKDEYIDSYIALLEEAVHSN